jgi:4-hydroxybenzoate polyprenyltransferase
MSNTVFFDLRDVNADRDFGVRTIPVAFGITKTYTLMSVFDALSAVYVIALTAIHFFPTYCLVMISLPVYSLVYRWASQRPGANLGVICDFVADGEYLLWGPLMLFGKII